MAVLGTTRHPRRRLRPPRAAPRPGRHRQPTTGEVVDTYRSADAPDGLVYKPCGTRRASVCPSCARTYQYDAYHLLKAGLAGSRSAGVPEDVALRPVVLLTLTAPSFGPSTACRHAGRQADALPRSPGQAAVPARPARLVHPPSPPRRPGHRQAAVPGLLRPRRARRLEPPRLRTVAPHLASPCAAPSRRLGKGHGVKLRIAFGKVAEYQARGVVHFHALIRLDAVTTPRPGPSSSPHPTASTSTTSPTSFARPAPRPRSDRAAPRLAAAAPAGG